MSTDTATLEKGEDRVVLRDLTYEFYKKFCEDIGRQPAKLAFWNGDLEIMKSRPLHEFYKKMLGRLIDFMALELNIPVAFGGSMTLQRDDLKVGLEPDDCWWIAHEAIVRTRMEFDFCVDPPPDLAIDVELVRSYVSRSSIFAAIGIPEVWRFDGKRLRFCILNAGGNYDDSESSIAFPFLKPTDIMPYLGPPNDPLDEMSRVKAFVNWARSQNSK
jgi:Uma2 family endonuclease